MMLREFLKAILDLDVEQDKELVVRVPEWETARAVESVEVNEDAVVFNAGEDDGPD